MKAKVHSNEALIEIVRASIRTIRASKGARPKLTKAILGAGIVQEFYHQRMWDTEEGHE